MSGRTHVSKLFGIILLVATVASPSAYAGSYAPLDCGKASTPTEHTICRNYDLGQQEARMATLFAISTSLVAMGQRGSIQDAQRAWLSERDACGSDIACLARAYDKRIRELNDVIAAIASRGPF